VIGIQRFGGEVVDKFSLEALLQCLAIREFPIIVVPELV